MRTNFSIVQLNDPRLAEADSILRNCVHCGFCTATCPTYVLLGNELDSPRGRINLIKDMLENDLPADSNTVLHLDRCLSCYSCMTTCPSGVDYRRLVETAREHIDRTYTRSYADRLVRFFLSYILPYPVRLRHSLIMGRFAKPFSVLFSRIGLSPIASMLELIPHTVPVPPRIKDRVFRPQGKRHGRVVLLASCVQPVLDKETNEAAIALMNRLGIEVTVIDGCCGALDQHIGHNPKNHLDHARGLIDSLTSDLLGSQDAIVLTVSGCGTLIKDYERIFKDDSDYSEKASYVSSLACDFTEYISRIAPPPTSGVGLRVAYHGACSLQHAQGITDLPVSLLTSAGFEVMQPSESHLCCGSAGVYNILESSISSRLGERKALALELTRADVITAGNIGCLTQIGTYSSLPVIHIAKLLNWAYGGERPSELG